MAGLGDRVQIPSKKIGQVPREGVVVGVSGTLLTVRWSTGEESTITPSMGSLLVVGKTRGRGTPAPRGSRSASKKTTAPRVGSGRKVAKAAKAAKSPTKPKARSAKVAGAKSSSAAKPPKPAKGSSSSKRGGAKKSAAKAASREAKGRTRR